MSFPVTLVPTGVKESESHCTGTRTGRTQNKNWKLVFVVDRLSGCRYEVQVLRSVFNAGKSGQVRAGQGVHFQTRNLSFRDPCRRKVDIESVVAIANTKRGQIIAFDVCWAGCTGLAVCADVYFEMCRWRIGVVGPTANRGRARELHKTSNRQRQLPQTTIIPCGLQAADREALLFNASP